VAERDTEIGGLRLAKGLIWFVYAVVVAAEIILAIAFLLLLFGANPTAPFAEWIYRATNHIMQPFRGIFGNVQGDNHDSVLDLSILFAMFIYGLLALLVDALVKWLDSKIRELKTKQFYEELRDEQALTRQSAADPGQAARQSQMRQQQ
jgi:uncharacterized protein YggT (Ycf19 family)